MGGPQIPPHVYAKFGGVREAVVARHLGFRVHDGKVETIRGARPEIVSVRPATPHEIRLWVALIKERPTSADRWDEGYVQAVIDLCPIAPDDENGPERRLLWSVDHVPEASPDGNPYRVDPVDEPAT